MSQSIFALAVGIGLSILGCVYAGLTCSSTGHWGVGLQLCLQDPGKIFFHIVLLPIASASFAYSFPLGFIITLPRSKMIIAGCLLAFVISVTGIVVWQDAVAANLAPGDIADSTARRQLYDLETYLRDPAHHFTPESAHAEYLCAVGALNSAQRRPSLRFGLGVALTALAALQLGLLLWALLVHILQRASPQEAFANSLLLVIGSLTLWLVLHPYSEWYGNFGYYRLTNDRAWIVSGVLTVVVVIFALILTLRPNNPKLIVISINTAIASVVAILAKVKPDWLVAVAVAYSGLPWGFQLCIYALLSLFVAGSVWFGSPAQANERIATGAG